MNAKSAFTEHEENSIREPICVHDSRFLLMLYILCSVFFILCLIFSTISGIRKHDMETLLICIPVFGSLALLGIGLSISNLRRALLLYDSYFSYTPSFGRTRTYSYTEIQSIVQKRDQFILYGYDGSKLAAFEVNMPAFLNALYFLMEKRVPF